MDKIRNVLENEEIIQKIRAITPLKLIRDDDLKGLLKSSRMIEYETDEIIISEGENSRWLYFLITGEAGIRKEGELIGSLKRCGDLFGEMGIIDNSPRSASIIALTNTVCLAIDTAYAEKLKGNDKIVFDSILYRIFSEILAERLRKLNEELLKVKNDNYRLISELEIMKSDARVEMLH
ncbi:MAG: cyclic nucleotide-binding domain-containing protein [Deltaproteobacteria bacterium]|jgi:CRP-like cAMP-binding protein|nr:cyclic nucleotide-binding domain-containing protein [Deltaproteobacteria bacterium]